MQLSSSVNLHLEHVTAGYGKPVLDDISFSVSPGELIGLIGPNGSGKSTLLRVISGVLHPSVGGIRLGDCELAQLPPAQRARRIAVVPQGVRLPEAFTVAEVVLMGRTPYLSLFGKEQASDYRIAQAAMRQTGTWELAGRRIGELSGGEQQRVLIARALAQEPEVLLFDEATAHLDLRHQATIFTLVRSLVHQGLIVIAALHDLNLAALYADRLALLAEGKLLICDQPAAVLTPQWIERAYSVATVVTAHPLLHTPLVSLAPPSD